MPESNWRSGAARCVHYILHMSAAKTLHACIELMTEGRTTQRPVAERHTLPALVGCATTPAPRDTVRPVATLIGFDSSALAAALVPSFDEMGESESGELPPASGIWTVAPPKPDASNVSDASYWLRDLRVRG